MWITFRPSEDRQDDKFVENSNGLMERRHNCTVTRKDNGRWDIQIGWEYQSANKNIPILTRDCHNSDIDWLMRFGFIVPFFSVFENRYGMFVYKTWGKSEGVRQRKILAEYLDDLRMRRLYHWDADCVVG